MAGAGDSTIDPLADDVFPVRELGKRFAIFRTVDVSAVYRWMQSGRLATDGVRVLMPYVATPRGRHTTEAAIRAWIARLSGATSCVTDRPTSERRKREIAQAERELEAAGIR